MNRIIIGLLTLCFSFQAQATEIFKTGKVWIDKAYTIEVYYSPQKAVLLKSSTCYTPFKDEIACDLDVPESCRLFMNFDLGTVKIRILDGADVVGESTHKILGSTDIDQPLIDHQCSEKLPSNTTVTITHIDTFYLTVVNDANQDVVFSLTLWDNNTAVTFGQKSEITSSTPFASTYGKTFAKYDHFEIPGYVNLMSNEEWALHQQELIRLQNEPNVEPRQ